MSISKRTPLYAGMLLLTLGLTDAHAATNVSGSFGPGTAGPSRSTTQATDKLALIESERPVPNINRGTVKQAQALYRNLQQIRSAASERNAIGVREGLRQAQDRLAELYMPTSLRKLRQQSYRLRQTLLHDRVVLGGGLWLPLRAELQRVSMVIPAVNYRAANAAIDRGLAATREASNIKAQKALDDFESIVAQDYALIPLNKIKGDLRSAENAMTPAPIYWRGVSEAIESALAQIRWVSTEQAEGMISAYMNAVDALSALPADPHTARGDLMRTSASLRDMPVAQEFAQRANTLARSRPLQQASVRQLVNDMASQMHGLAGL
ncbi:MAG: hypothetical protein P8171_07745 [Candidatus Thiodiazotropha sp.]